MLGESQSRHLKAAAGAWGRSVAIKSANARSVLLEFCLETSPGLPVSLSDFTVADPQPAVYNPHLKRSEAYVPISRRRH
jgi:hypothetical protein